MKRFISFVLAFLLLCVPVFAKYDDFEELNIFVDILENGDARITEEWNVVNGDHGTEWYKPMTNMNHMDIKDFKVLFNGEPGEDMGKDWDTDLNFKKKAYKFGINKIGFKQYELCFGKSQRGPMKYTMSYTLTNFIERFKPDPKDRDNIKSGFIVKFVNDSMEPAPDVVKIKIKHENAEFNKKNTKIWAYGTGKGYVEFLDQKDENGNYFSENTSLISNSPGVVAFEADYFDGSDQVIIMLGTKLDLDGYQSRKTFIEMRDRAHEGSDYIERVNKIYRFVITLIALFIFLFIVVYIPLRIERWRKRLVKNLKDIDYKKRPYNRDSILHYGLTDIGWIGGQIKGIKTSNSSILSAMLLKWMNDGILDIREEDGEMKFIFSSTEPTEYNEQKVFRIAGLKGNTFNAKTLANSFSQKIEQIYKALATRFLLKEGNAKKVGKKFVLTEKGKDAFIDVKGAHDFLKDFTLIDEKEIRDLSLWNDYLIEATLFTMPKKVMNKLKKAMPQMPEVDQREREMIQRNMDMAMNSIHFIYGELNTAFKDYYERTSRENSRSSGSGGRSSRGGGGGSSGGGSGGGSR